ncbi:MAG TPA: flagellar assembly protein FliW [Egibacteraceae bacterium]|nr:flagellar assembly protein FliW [Egibacteraceae bacterium]
MTDTPSTATEAAAVRFVLPLPGFPQAREFVVEPVDGQDGVLSVLRCTDQPGLEFVVALPEAFFPDYTPELDDATAERLGLTDAADALVLVILTIAEQIEASTANLMAPVIVNRRTGEAVQALLVSSGYDIRTPLVG